MPFLLKQCYPQSEVYTTDLQKATALGAAICGLALLEDKNPSELTQHLDIKAEKISASPQINVKPYMQKFLQFIA